jgi:hypothetical protein
MTFSLEQLGVQRCAVTAKRRRLRARKEATTLEAIILSEIE